MCEAVGAVYAKDLIVASKENTVENSQHEVQEHRATNPRDDLPGPQALRFKRGQQGELIIDCKPYMDSMEPDIKANYEGSSRS